MKILVVIRRLLMRQVKWSFWRNCRSLVRQRKMAVILSTRLLSWNLWRLRTRTKWHDCICIQTETELESFTCLKCVLRDIGNANYLHVASYVHSRNHNLNASCVITTPHTLSMLNLFNGKEQKEHIDEVLEDLLANNGFEQSFKSEFVFLSIQYAAVLVALYVYYIERTRSFSESKWLIGMFCLVYYTLQVSAYLWHRFVEKNAVYVGVEKATNRKVLIKTENPLNSPDYVVTIYDGSKELAHTFQFPEVVDNSGMIHTEQLKPILTLLSRKNE